MHTDDTYTFVWIEAYPRGTGIVEIHRENPRAGFSRSRRYWEAEITPASFRRLTWALLALGGTLERPNGVYESPDEDEAVLEYVHRPQGCAQRWDLDYWYSQMGDSDWCAAPYDGFSTPFWDGARGIYAYRFAA